MDDATDEALTRELDSARGKHPKFVSHMADANFRTEIIHYLRERGYIKGEPNLTILNICSWVRENYEDDISKSSMSNWLHDLGVFLSAVYKGSLL